jgi:hypothetical protein
MHPAETCPRGAHQVPVQFHSTTMRNEHTYHQKAHQVVWHPSAACTQGELQGALHMTLRHMPMTWT